MTLFAALQLPLCMAEAPQASGMRCLRARCCPTTPCTACSPVAVSFNEKNVPAETGLWALIRAVRAYRVVR